MINERELEYQRRLVIIKKVLETERRSLSAEEYFEKYGTYHISDKIEFFRNGQKRIIYFMLGTTLINASGFMSKELLFVILGITAVSTILLLMKNKTLK